MTAHRESTTFSRRTGANQRLAVAILRLSGRVALGRDSGHTSIVSREDDGPLSSSHDFSATVSVRFRDSMPNLVVSAWRRRAWLGAAVVVSLVLLGFAVHGGWSLARDRSMDLVSQNDLRVGFYGASWFSHWVCSDGHDHWSAPYWFGILLLAPPTGLFWYGWSRRRG